MKKYKYKIQNLDCANCAQKVQDLLNKDSNIENCILNFNKLTLELETSYDKDIKNTIEKIAKKAEPDIKILETNEEHKEEIIIDIIKIITSIILMLIAQLIFKDNKIIYYILYITAYIISLYEIILKSIKLLIKSHTINEKLLITISSIGAFIIKEYIDGLMVVILYNIGEILEHLAVNNSRKSISDLMNIKPEYANLKNNNEIIKVSPEEVKINDVIIIKKGEKIPLDGIIIKGTSKINTSALTGESKLQDVTINDTVLSGSINEGNIIEIKVTKDYDNSTVSKILELVENASNRKAKSENFVTKASKIYTPIVILCSIISYILLIFIFEIDKTTALYRSLSFLVVSCPCAIAISVPLSYFTGIGTASKNGILIKGSDYLDNLRNIKTIIFDKTGTITTGKFTDYKLNIIDNTYNEKEIIEMYCLGESFSNHPIAKSILDIFKIKLDTKKITNYKEIEGKGIEYKLKDKTIKIGSSTFVNNKEKTSLIYLKIENKIIASLELIDGIKKEAPNTIKELKKQGIEPIMFTGDEKEIALEVSKKCGIENIKYELLPDQKYELLKEEIIKSKKVAFIGDGINDAPSIRLADIGISMGNIGSQAAIEASDIVISNDELTSLIKAIKISKYTNKIVKQNLIFSLSIKIIVLILCALGIANMSLAVFADTGVTVLAILNTTRIIKLK